MGDPELEILKSLRNTMTATNENPKIAMPAAIHLFGSSQFTVSADWSETTSGW
jgi:hypothetical protein